MSVSEALHRFCHIEGAEPAAPEDRRRALVELALVVAAALAFLAMSRLGARNAVWLRVNTVFQLALPFLSAGTLRRIAGRRIFFLALILEAGLVLSGMLSGWTSPTGDFTLHAMIAAGMPWVMGSDPRTSTRAMLLGGTLVALAMAVSALI